MARRHAAEQRGSLLRVEFSRFARRRFIQILLGLGVLGFVVVAIVAFIVFSRPTPELLAEAEAQRATDLQMSEQFRQECLADPSIPEEERESACGPPLEAESIPLEQYLDKTPFDLATDLPAGALGVAAVTAALGFVIGGRTSEPSGPAARSWRCCSGRPGGCA